MTSPRRSALPFLAVIVILFLVIGTSASAQWTIGFEPSDRGLAGISFSDAAFGFSRSGMVYFATNDGISRYDFSESRWRMVHQGERVYAFGTDSSGVMLSGRGDGIHRSEDDGISWRKVADLTWARSLLNDGRGNWYARNGDEVYRSTDGGLVWTPLRAEYNATHYSIGHRDVALTPKGDLVVGIHDGILLSSDAGATWHSRNLGDRIEGVAVSGTGVILAAGRREFHRSLDSGATWTSGGSIHGLRGSGPLWYDRDGNVYTSFCQREIGGVQSGLFRSTDDGANWSVVHPGVVSKFGVAPDGLIWIESGTTIYNSCDGIKWAEQITGLEQAALISMIADSTGYLYALVYASDDCDVTQRLYGSSDDGHTWNRISDDIATLIPARQSRGLLFGSVPNPLLPTRAASRVPALSTDNGATWQRIPSGRIVTEVDRGRNGTIAIAYALFGAGEGSVMTSIDNGASWRESLPGVSAGSVRVTGSGSIVAAVHGYGPYALHPDSSGIYRSTDNGASWSRMTDSMVAGRIIEDAEGRLFAAAFLLPFVQKDPDDPLGVDTAYLDRIYRSTDDGRTWEPVIEDIYVISLQLSPTGSLIIRTPQGVLRSSDAGETWNAFIDDRRILATLHFDPRGNIYTLKNGMLHGSSDDGLTWQTIQSGLDQYAHDIPLISPAGTIFIYIPGGLLRSTGVSAVATDAASPSHVRLGAPRTGSDPSSRLITIDLPQSGNVSLHLVDLTGRPLSTLHKGWMPAGRSHILLPLKDHARGAYLIVLRSDHGQASGMVLLP